MASQSHSPHRSLFWPILLIGIGLLWLLSSLGNIIDINLPVLFRLWPLLLIFIGLDFLVGRRHPLAGAALGAAAILIAAGFILSGRALGLSPDIQVKTEHFQVPLDQAQSASVELVLSDSPALIQALPDSASLMDAQISYVGSMNFHTSGTVQKTVRLARNEADFLLFSPLYWDPTLAWQIGLSTHLPLDLSLSGGSGSSQVDLSQLRIGTVKANLGSGSSHWIAPGITQPSTFTLDGGSGSIELEILAGAQLTLDIRGGSGSIQVKLPADPAVRVDVRDHGSGGVRFPPGWLRTNSTNKDEDEGVWTSPTYTQANHKVEITILHVGSGSISFTTE